MTYEVRGLSGTFAFLSALALLGLFHLSGEKRLALSRLLNFRPTMEVHLVALKNRAGPEEPLHWLLYIGETMSKGQIYNAVGSSRDYKFESRKAKDILDDSDYATSVQICSISKEAHSKLVDTLADVQIRNFDPEYNCQAWIWLASRELVDLGYVEIEKVTKILENFPKKVKDIQ